MMLLYVINNQFLPKQHIQLLPLLLIPTKFIIILPIIILNLILIIPNLISLPITLE